MHNNHYSIYNMEILIFYIYKHFFIPDFNTENSCMNWN